MIYDQFHIDGDELVIETVDNRDGETISVICEQRVWLAALRETAVAVIRGEMVAPTQVQAYRARLRLVEPCR